MLHRTLCRALDGSPMGRAEGAPVHGPRVRPRTGGRGATERPAPGNAGARAGERESRDRGDAHVAAAGHQHPGAPLQLRRASRGTPTPRDRGRLGRAGAAPGVRLGGSQGAPRRRAWPRWETGENLRLSCRGASSTCQPAARCRGRSTWDPGDELELGVDLSPSADRRLAVWLTPANGATEPVAEIAAPRGKCASRFRSSASVPCGSRWPRSTATTRPPARPAQRAARLT